MIYTLHLSTCDSKFSFFLLLQVVDEFLIDGVPVDVDLRRKEKCLAQEMLMMLESWR